MGSPQLSHSAVYRSSRRTIEFSIGRCSRTRQRRLIAQRYVLEAITEGPRLIVASGIREGVASEQCLPPTHCGHFRASSSPTSLSGCVPASSSARVRPAESSARERALSYVRSIPVVDANGDRLTVHEFRSGPFFRRVRRYELCTGETVISAGDQFIVVASGEQLLRL